MSQVGVSGGLLRSDVTAWLNLHQNPKIAPAATPVVFHVHPHPRGYELLFLEPGLRVEWGSLSKTGLERWESQAERGRLGIGELPREWGSRKGGGVFPAWCRPARKAVGAAGARVALWVLPSLLWRGCSCPRGPHLFSEVRLPILRESISSQVAKGLSGRV